MVMKAPRKRATPRTRWTDAVSRDMTTVGLERKMVDDRRRSGEEPSVTTAATPDDGTAGGTEEEKPSVRKLPVSENVNFWSSAKPASANSESVTSLFAHYAAPILVLLRAASTGA